MPAGFRVHIDRLRNSSARLKARAGSCVRYNPPVTECDPSFWHGTTVRSGFFSPLDSWVCLVVTVYEICTQIHLQSEDRFLTLFVWMYFSMVFESRDKESRSESYLRLKRNPQFLVKFCGADASLNCLSKVLYTLKFVGVEVVCCGGCETAGCCGCC